MHARRLGLVKTTLGLAVGMMLAASADQLFAQAQSIPTGSATSRAEPAGQEHGESETPNAADTEKLHLFRLAYTQFREEDFVQASEGFHHFMTISSRDEENYQWAQFFLGLALEKLQYSHAAVDVLADLARRKPNTRIVAYVLEMFETISRSRPFDRELVLQQVLNAQDYDFTDPRVADFVHYYQGVDDWENGLMEWGDRHFQAIRKDGYYAYALQLHRARQRLHQGDAEAASGLLKDLLADIERQPHAAVLQETGFQDLLDQIRWSLARLQYEQGDYAGALRNYQRIKTPLVEHASLLMEQAWNAYRNGGADKAMGYLYAFEAPSFKRFFTPEFYIVKSFIYKDVCHYDAALGMVDAFHQRYGQALNAIVQRKTVANQETREVLDIALGRERISREWAFLQLLESEQAALEKLPDGALRGYLQEIYALQIEQTGRGLQRRLDVEFESIANTLLQYEEETDLMRYEIGIDKYQRVAQSHYRQGEDGGSAAPSDPNALKTVVFPFQGEFWNEELGHYRVTLPDRCNEVEEWDVLFK